MNEQQFNASLKAAFVAPEMPVHMDHKIDEAVNRLKNRNVIRRRLTVSFGATAMVAAGIFIFPAVQAQASLGGMMSALDKQTKARIVNYSIDENGNRKPVGTTIISDGNVESRDAKGHVQQVDFENDSFSYDLVANVYVRYPRRGNHGIRLSQMVGPASSFSVKKQVSIKSINENGRQFLRATIVNGDLPERYIIDADPITQLPFHIQVESFELNRWRIRQDGVFDYRADLKVSKPDFSKSPLVTKEQKNAMFNTSMTRNDLAKVEAKNKTLIVRAIDVSEDGTVFVAYQSGDMNLNSWSGYHLSLSDNLGTNYVRAGDAFVSFDNATKVPKDGKLELEIFLPTEPATRFTKRELSLKVAKDASGNIDIVSPMDDFEKGKTRINVKYPDGHIEPKSYPRSGGKGKFVEVIKKEFATSTCGVRPTWAGEIGSNFYHEIHAEVFKANRRGNYAIDTKDWITAEKYIQEELYWMRESEAKGLSPFAMDSALRNLEVVQKHLHPK